MIDFSIAGYAAEHGLSDDDIALLERVWRDETFQSDLVEAIDLIPKWPVPTADIVPIYLPQLNNYARTQILYGGSSSGKSKFKAQQAVIDVLNNRRNWLICRKIGRDNRYSTYVEVIKVIEEWNLSSRFTINKTDLTITADTGYQVIFKGLDDLEKIKSIVSAKGAITDVWVEEATQTSQDDIRQLIRRQRGGDKNIRKRLHLTFNPILKLNWIYQEYFVPSGWVDDQTEFQSDNLTILKTTYKDNPFLAEDEIAILEDETDPYWHDVYTLGNWGVLGDVIFTNWEVCDLSGMHDQFTNRNDGLDFGFGGSPAAYGSIHYDKTRRTVYVFNEVYGREMTDDVLADEIRPYCGDNYVTCDSAEPKSVQTLANCGIKAIGAKKGQGSLEHGYRWLLSVKIVVDKSCVNTVTELQLHQWKQDKDGNRLNKPQDKFNHMVAAMRYGLESEMLEAKAAMRQAKVRGRRQRV